MNEKHNLREFGCKLPSSLPRHVRERRPGSGVRLILLVGTWVVLSSKVFLRNSLLGTPLGGSGYANTTSISFKNQILKMVPLMLLVGARPLTPVPFLIIFGHHGGPHSDAHCRDNLLTHRPIWTPLGSTCAYVFSPVFVFLCL